MQAYKVVIALVAMTVAWFWMAWWSEIQTYRCNVAAIEATLLERKLTDVRLFPKSPGCFSYQAAKGYRIVSGEICVGDK